MRLRIPPTLPTYLLLVLVVVFAVGAGWLGLSRLDTIERLGESRATSAATVQDLQALQNAVVDIETSVRGFVLTGDAADLELYERGRRDIPPLLARLRDGMRDDADELALIESLVPLIAKRTTLAASAIDQKRSAPNQPLPIEAGRPGRETSEAIRAIVAKLTAREEEQLARDRRTLVAALGAAQRDMYLLAGLIVLLAVLLFLAVRRLRALIPPELHIEPASTVDLQPAPVSVDGRVATLLQDALLRARIAAAAAPRDSAAHERLGALVAAMERARDEHARVEADLEQPRSEAENIIEALTLLAQSYSQPGGPTVRATMDRTVGVFGRDKAFLIYRSAEWALEAMALRKRTGEITLHVTAEGAAASLRIMALPDNPDPPLLLSPKERDEAAVLKQAVTALGGSFVISQSPTGFALVLVLPGDR